ncbi:MAG TPA: RNA polymerase sigma factor [Methylomirabilota bacterium]|nr:RNA polymerase sigma factor [Methylomirabilota bacterium]
MDDQLDIETLVDQHQAALYRFALSLSHNESDALDLVQETFCLWMRKGGQLLDRGKVKAWLFTTLHREFLGRRRRLVRFPHHELTEVESELPEIPPVPADQADRERLLECLARLDPVFRAPVALFYLEEYAYQDIASILDVPLGTVKSRISRGVAQLQEMFHRPLEPSREASR